MLLRDKTLFWCQRGKGTERKKERDREKGRERKREREREARKLWAPAALPFPLLLTDWQHSACCMQEGQLWEELLGVSSGSQISSLSSCHRQNIWGCFWMNQGIFKGLLSALKHCRRAEGPWYLAPSCLLQAPVHGPPGRFSWSPQQVTWMLQKKKIKIPKHSLFSVPLPATLSLLLQSRIHRGGIWSQIHLPELETLSHCLALQSIVKRERRQFTCLPSPLTVRWSYSI